MPGSRLMHDTAVAAAKALLDMAAPALRSDQRRVYFDECYCICLAMLEAYEQQVQRERRGCAGRPGTDMKRFRVLVVPLFVIAGVLWCGSVVYCDLTSPERWGDWSHDVRRYGPLLLLVIVAQITIVVNALRWRHRWDRMTREERAEEANAHPEDWAPIRKGREAMPQELESLDEVIERLALGSEMGAVAPQCIQERQRMLTESDPERLAQVRQQIRASACGASGGPAGVSEGAARAQGRLPTLGRRAGAGQAVHAAGPGGLVGDKQQDNGNHPPRRTRRGQAHYRAYGMLIRLAEPEPALRQGKVSLDELKRTANGRQHGQAKGRECGVKR